MKNKEIYLVKKLDFPVVTPVKLLKRENIYMHKIPLSIKKIRYFLASY